MCTIYMYIVHTGTYAKARHACNYHKYGYLGNVVKFDHVMHIHMCMCYRVRSWVSTHVDVVVSHIRALPYGRQYMYGTSQQYAQQKKVFDRSPAPLVCPF